MRKDVVKTPPELSLTAGEKIDGIHYVRTGPPKGPGDDPVMTIASTDQVRSGLLPGSGVPARGTDRVRGDVY